MIEKDHFVHDDRAVHAKADGSMLPHVQFDWPNLHFTGIYVFRAQRMNKQIDNVHCAIRAFEIDQGQLLS